MQARQNAASLNKIDGKYYHEISGINKPDYNLYDEIEKIRTWMSDTGFEDPRMEIRFGGLTQQGDEASSFLVLAFIGALFLMFIILVTQFNKHCPALYNFDFSFIFNCWCVPRFNHCTSRTIDHNDWNGSSGLGWNCGE